MMTPEDLIKALRSRINPEYAATHGTESYERRICVEVIEALVSERDNLLRIIEEDDSRPVE